MLYNKDSSSNLILDIWKYAQLSSRPAGSETEWTRQRQSAAMYNQQTVATGD